MQNLATGFLIAMPQLGDPNFHRAVILMIEHGEGGAMGLVINHPASLTLDDVGKGQELTVGRLRRLQSVFSGGPVEPQRGFVLHDNAAIEEKHELLPGLYLSVTLDALGPLLAEDTSKVRFCLGYAGWGPRQLDEELSQGSWLFTEATVAAVLDGEPGKLWENTLRGMGVDPAMIVSGGGVH